MRRAASVSWSIWCVAIGSMLSGCSSTPWLNDRNVESDAQFQGYVGEIYAVARLRNAALWKYEQATGGRDLREDDPRWRGIDEEYYELWEDAMRMHLVHMGLLSGIERGRHLDGGGWKRYHKDSLKEFYAEWHDPEKDRLERLDVLQRKIGRLAGEYAASSALGDKASTRAE